MSELLTCQILPDCVVYAITEVLCKQQRDELFCDKLLQTMEKNIKIKKYIETILHGKYERDNMQITNEHGQEYKTTVCSTHINNKMVNIQFVGSHKNTIRGNVSFPLSNCNYHALYNLNCTFLAALVRRLREFYGLNTLIKFIDDLRLAGMKERDARYLLCISSAIMNWQYTAQFGTNSSMLNYITTEWLKSNSSKNVIHFNDSNSNLWRVPEYENIQSIYFEQGKRIPLRHNDVQLEMLMFEHETLKVECNEKNRRMLLNIYIYNATHSLTFEIIELNRKNGTKSYRYILTDGPEDTLENSQAQQTCSYVINSNSYFDHFISEYNRTEQFKTICMNREQNKNEEKGMRKTIRYLCRHEPAFIISILLLTLAVTLSIISYCFKTVHDKDVKFN